MPQLIPVAGAALGGAVTTALGGTLFANLVGGFVTLGFNLLGGSLADRPAQQKDQRTRDFDPFPPFRFAFGNFGQEGTVIFHHAKGQFYYLTLLLNSVPSKFRGISKIEINDGIELVVEGLTGPATFFGRAMDAYDMTKGAEASGPVPFDASASGNFVTAQFWIGDGTQTAPPSRWLAEIPEVISVTDTWEGLTVVHVRLDYGGSTEAAQRWTNGRPPPLKFFGDWSLVYDPRLDGTSGVAGASGSQDRDDPTTWAYSANAALCALRLVRDAKALGFEDETILIQQWADAADDCDVDLPNFGKYECSGLVTIGQRELSLLDPVLACMAGSLDTTDGFLGVRAGSWHAPSITLSEPVGDTVEVRGARDAGFDLVRAKFLGEHNAEEPSDGQGYSLRAGNREHPLQLPLVKAAAQAARLEKVVALRAEPNRVIVARWDGREALRRVGERVNFSLPGFTRADGTFVVTSKSLVTQELGDGEFDVAVEMTLTEDLAATYADEAFTPPAQVTPPAQESPSQDPPTGVVVSQSDATIGGVLTPRLRIDIELDAFGANADTIQVLVNDGGGFFVHTSVEVVPGTTSYVVFFSPATIGATYTAAARTFSEAMGQSALMFGNSIVITAPVVDFSSADFSGEFA